MMVLLWAVGCTDPALVKENEDLKAEVERLGAELEAARTAEAAAKAEIEALRRRYSPSTRRCEGGALPAAALESFSASGLRAEGRTVQQGDGLLVTGLKADGLLVSCGLANGDVLLRLDGKPWSDWSPTLGQGTLKVEIERKGDPLALELAVR